MSPLFYAVGAGGHSQMTVQRYNLFFKCANFSFLFGQNYTFQSKKARFRDTKKQRISEAFTMRLYSITYAS